MIRYRRKSNAAETLFSHVPHHPTPHIPRSTSLVPQLLLGELHRIVSVNDGNFLEALHPGLLSAVADIVETVPKDGHAAQDGAGVPARRVGSYSPPVTWEEVHERLGLSGEGDSFAVLSSWGEGEGCSRGRIASSGRSCPQLDTSA